MPGYSDNDIDDDDVGLDDDCSSQVEDDEEAVDEFEYEGEDDDDDNDDNDDGEQEDEEMAEQLNDNDNDNDDTDGRDHDIGEYEEDGDDDSELGFDAEDDEVDHDDDDDEDISQEIIDLLREEEENDSRVNRPPFTSSIPSATPSSVGQKSQSQSQPVSLPLPLQSRTPRQQCQASRRQTNCTPTQNHIRSRSKRPAKMSSTASKPPSSNPSYSDECGSVPRFVSELMPGGGGSGNASASASLKATIPTALSYATQHDISKLNPAAQHLTTYEQAKILGVRIMQLTTGSPPFLHPDRVEAIRAACMSDPCPSAVFERIAKEELAHNRIPFFICRTDSNGKRDIYRVCDLKQPFLS